MTMVSRSLLRTSDFTSDVINLIRNISSVLLIVCNVLPDYSFHFVVLYILPLSLPLLLVNVSVSIFSQPRIIFSPLDLMVGLVCCILF